MISNELLPEELHEYYRGLIVKHFGDSSLGSVFSKTETLNGVVARFLSTHPAIVDGVALEDQDDRKLLERQYGVKQAAFMFNRGYFVVSGQGRLGMIDARQLPADTVVTLIPSPKNQNELCFVCRGIAFQEVDFATMVVAPNQMQEATTKYALVAVFPGPPMDVAQSSVLLIDNEGMETEHASMFKAYDKMPLETLKDLLQLNDLVLQLDGRSVMQDSIPLNSESDTTISL